MQDQFKKAQRQARIAVIDVQRCGLPDDLALRQIRRRFHGQKRIVRMFVFDHEDRVTELNHGDNL
ncbi:hypothetical protein G7066_05395 [Leucobacter coleopterorum]|uniref:Uncharacterized protein n=1 Tax=Leucobacter coleopterorum TaxID=2714933 RepID=A0ABX6JZC8_9MICO|nr:hypothetical protein G7066_05395 [Leucobacter coleopterorum]